MSLSDARLKAVRPREKPYRLFDEKGLYLEVTPPGGKYWRFKYRFAGKEKRLALGVYPEVSLKDARNLRDEARTQLRNDTDPASERKQAKVVQAIEQRAASETFRKVAAEWLEKNSPKWSAGHTGTIADRLEANIYPWLGDQPISSIDAPALLEAITRIEERGAPEVARRVLQVCSQIFRYAVSRNLATRDPAADLRGAIPPPAVRHHASITDPRKIGELLRNLYDYQGSFPTRCALRLAPLVFVRPGELRRAEWAEFNLEGEHPEWRIPAVKMKGRALHIVPLARQAVAILGELKPLTGSGQYLFPSIRSPSRPMSENTVNAALRRIGYTIEEMTGHGFRSMASTLLNEQGWHPDAIERQLAHTDKDKVRGAYNYAQHLPERRKMMQAWADHLDVLRASTDNVVPMRRRG